MATDVKALTVGSASLTTATTAYTAADQVGGLFTFANMAQAAAGSGLITSICLTDDSDIIGQYTVFLFNASVTPASDNAVFALSDADNAKTIASIRLGPVEDVGGARQCAWYGGPIAYTLAGGVTSMFALLRTDAGHTFFGAAGALNLTIGVIRT